jgi:SAM-dependent methyltransferase
MDADLPTEIAANLAATAAFLEMAEELGISALLDQGSLFTLDEAVRMSPMVPEAGMAAFLSALVTSGLIERHHSDQKFVACADFADRRYEAGYLEWALNANQPYLETAPDFLRDYADASAKYSRDGRRVATFSRWVGSRGFHPQTSAEIMISDPRRIVDLGAGEGRLLINLLRELSRSTGVAIDLNEAACAEAIRTVDRADVGDRLQVINRPIQSLVNDPSPLAGADVVHAAFVVHDIVGNPEVFDAVLGACRESLADDGKMVIVDAVPYASEARERAFSALFTYLPVRSMGVELPSQYDWETAMRRAGFTRVTCTPLQMPSSRMFVACG